MCVCRRSARAFSDAVIFSSLGPRVAPAAGRVNTAVSCGTDDNGTTTMWGVQGTISLRCAINVDNGIYRLTLAMNMLHYFKMVGILSYSVINHE